MRQPSLHLRACTFAHVAATPVLEDVDLDLGPGWTGVVGANGSGKSTLLRLVAGELAPTAGEVHVVADVPPVSCPQEVGEPDGGLRAFSWDWTGEAARLRSRLGLDPDDLDRWPTLSPGERKRWQVGAALAAEPDVLLLDEPTNHLDADARGLLLDVLATFGGLGLVVSHDRTLLDRLTDRTVRVVHGRVELHAGSYREARPRWQADEAAQRDAHARARREEKRLRRVLGEVRHDRLGAEHAPRAARRNAPNEPDARESGRKFAGQKAEAKLANRIGQVHARIDRASAEVASFDLRRTLGGELRVQHADSGRRVAVQLAGAVRHGGGGVVLDHVDVAVDRGEHVHVRGPNGAGKSTLLDALVAAAPGTVGVLRQDVTPAAVAGDLAFARSLDPDLRGRLLGIVATLGVDPDRLLVTDAPSPGEARKLALARLLLEPVDLLVLDEPTNHLDLPSIERLEEAVADHPGAVLLATHDRAFAEATTGTSWDLADGRLRTSTRPVPPEPSP